MAITVLRLRGRKNKMTNIRVVFEFEIIKYSNVPEGAERFIREYAKTGDSLVDVAGVYSQEKGEPWIRWD